MTARLASNLQACGCNDRMASSPLVALRREDGPWTACRLHPRRTGNGSENFKLSRIALRGSRTVRGQVRAVGQDR